MIAGVPLVRDFFELANNPEFIYFKLDIEKSEDYFIHVNLGQQCTHKDRLTGQLSIGDFVDKSAQPLSFNEFFDAIREIKKSGEDYGLFHRFYFSSGYKPVYFLLPCTMDCDSP